MRTSIEDFVRLIAVKPRILCRGSIEEAYSELIGDRSPEEFWTEVEERLPAGQMSAGAEVIVEFLRIVRCGTQTSTPSS